MKTPLNAAQWQPVGFNNNYDKPSPGEYTSTVIKIEEAPSYKAGDAYKITYLMSSTEDSREFEKSEIFINSMQNERTAKLINDWKNDGFIVNNIEDILGVMESVTLEYEVIRGNPYLNITKRNFVGIDNLYTYKDDDDGNA